MKEDFFLSPLLERRQEAIADILVRNENAPPGVPALTRREAEQLVQIRAESLKKYGRVEFGGGTISRLIEAFQTSPCLTPQTYATVLGELVETFYYFKNEALEGWADDELIRVMRTSFDEECHGSVELLQGTALEIRSRILRGCEEGDGSEPFREGDDAL